MQNRKLGKKLGEFLNILLDACVCTGIGCIMKGCGQNALFVFSCIPVQRFDGGITDSTLGGIDDPVQTDRVIGIDQKLQICDGIFDLLALPETDASDDLIGNTVSDERLARRRDCA